MTEDMFGLDLEREGSNVAKPLGLVVPGVIPGADLEIIEACYRVAHPACHNVTFVEVDDDRPGGDGAITGVETFTNAKLWQGILGFRREPTLDEVEDWQRYHAAKLDAATYYTLQNAPPVPPPVKVVPIEPAEEKPASGAPRRGPTA
jgi:hypothetical protein